MNSSIPISALMPNPPRIKNQTINHLKLWIACLILWNLIITAQLLHLPQNPNIPESTPSEAIGLDITDVPPELMLEPLEDLE